VQIVAVMDLQTPKCDVTRDTAYRLLIQAAFAKEGKAMIKKVRGGYQVLSESTGRNLGGPYKTLDEAKKRLRQVEFFKRRKG